MEILVNYNITSDCGEDSIKLLAQSLPEVLNFSKITVDKNSISIDAAEYEIDYEDIFEYTALTLAKKINSAVSDISFRMTGTIDTSFYAGEYMDFDITVSDNSLTALASDWYLINGINDSYTLEDFIKDCYENDDITFTPDEIEKFRNCEYIYELETDNGTVVTDRVPLSLYKL